MYGIYNAGPLFNKAERQQRKIEGANLMHNFGSKFKIFNPVEFDFNSGDVVPTNKEIFDYDYNCMTKSKYFLFDIDGRDDGTFVELGIAIQMALNDSDKFIIGIFSDFRIGKANQGEWPGYGINEFVTGPFYNEKLVNNKKMSQIYMVESHDKAIELIHEIEKVQNKNFDETEIEILNNKFHDFKKNSW
ncbi:hypothetical protein SSABA_v1c08690 [Spiroplasma sabaudiense Ar-1343]|uniref:Nucleoside 2-deoxyribosyltransferase n=1 Tax=Spiroplasma sabaudiense Ar-1343 TaxID=1276257 RepID=W6AAT2_9MOLU|nr:nucleoside 2-deoxyribosyltransferase [Spiroplasma sabaudiense]AHI54268.1 hypothetical protein SSABA_v1c08690 [Spiroplasma sabaudiense Ar-1343]